MRMVRSAAVGSSLLLGLLLIAGAQTTAPDSAIEATSLLGKPLRAVPLSAERSLMLATNLEAARVAFDSDPTDEMAIIWYGRRLGYLGRYREAVSVFTRGIEIHPESFKLRRHRGHRYLTLRRIDAAIADLARATDLAESHPDAIEPDGAPNALGIPRSTTKGNIYYHLGLAHYLTGNWRRSRWAFRRALGVATNDDSRCAASYWIYLTLARQGGRPRHILDLLEPITETMEVVENHAYHELLLLFKGERNADAIMKGHEPGSVDHATRAYGVACSHLIAGDTEMAQEWLQTIIGGPMWPAFGHLAAEADLARSATP